MDANAAWIPRMQPAERVEMCPTHPTKPLEFYCKSEKVMICHTCIKKHKDHDYVVISEVKNTLSIQQLVGEVENAIAYVKGRRKVVSTKEEENLKKLDDTFYTLRAALDSRHKELKENIMKTSQNLQEQENRLRSLLRELKSCHPIEDEVQRGVNQDVLASMLEKGDRLKEVKKKTKEQYPLSIKLKDMDKVVNFISQLQLE